MDPQKQPDPAQTDGSSEEPRHRRDDSTSEPEANPTPPATDATTADDVQDSPQLPPEGNRGAASE